MEEVKRIPYGVANFVEVMEQNMYYVDKTMCLPLLENQPSNLFFIRPRRFGKSIFLSMLRAYYDIAQKEKFEKRFGSWWIGSQPTHLQEDSEAKAEAQWQEAITQIKGYAAAPKVRQMVHDTELHCIVMQFRGWELERMEEV